MCHCLLRVSCGKRLLRCIDKGEGRMDDAPGALCALCADWGAVHKTVATGQVQPCAAICTDGEERGGGHVLLQKSIMFGFRSGRACLRDGRRIWCSANPLCDGAAAAATPPTPPTAPSPPPPHPAPSLLVLLTGVYVKALRKTITLNCTQPSGSKPAEVDGVACVCTRVLMFADLTVNPPPQERCSWAAALASSNVCALICFTTRTHGADRFVLGWGDVVRGPGVPEKGSKAGTRKKCEM